MVPDIDRKKNCLRCLSADPQQGGIIGIINGELTQAQRLLWQVEVLLQRIADIEQGQTGVGKAAVDTDKMKLKHGCFR